MPESYIFYSQTCDQLPETALEDLAKQLQAEYSRRDEDGFKEYTFQWQGLSIVCAAMRDAEQSQHLTEFSDLTRELLQQATAERAAQIRKRIDATRMVVVLGVEPGPDRQGRTNKLLSSFSEGLQAMSAHRGALYDSEGRLILAPDGKFDDDSDVLGPVTQIESARSSEDTPEDQRPRANAAQLERYKRIVDVVREKHVPTLSYPLVVADDSAVRLRSPQDTARRVLAISAVVQLVDGGTSEHSNALIERHAELVEFVSPVELEFLQSAEPDPGMARLLDWRREGLLTLAWALGKVELNWPSGCCDVRRLADLCRAWEADPEFIASARLRPAAEIFDAQQQILLIHWALRDAWVRRQNIPVNLDWSNASEWVGVQETPASAVVVERHCALNWLTRAEEADWDEMHTPT